MIMIIKRAGRALYAPPLSASGKVVSLAIILLSPPVRFPALTPIEPQAPPLVVPPRQFRGKWELGGQIKRIKTKNKPNYHHFISQDPC